jgi:integrase
MNATHMLHDGKLQLFSRNGFWQARVYLGERRYLWRSLKTVDLERAKALGTQLFHETQFKLKSGLPTHQRSVNAVIDEYVAWRQRDHAQGKAAGHSNTKFTSDHMLRQVTRVVKFWRAYAGKRAIEVMDDKMLAAYVPWRRAYYHNMPTLPKNARLHPTDKTLQWEIMLGKSLIKFAHDAGYRGNKPLPTFTFVPKVKRVRPAFTLWEYRQLYRGMRSWIHEAATDRARRSRQLLRDYVLVLANSGMRVGEANNLRVRDVVHFKDSLGRNNVQLHVDGKTGPRVVIPRVNARRYIARVLEIHPDPHPDAWLFCDAHGEPITTLIEPFNQVLMRAGILTNSAGEKFTLYSLRHFYATQNIQSGLDIYMIAKNMGTSVAVIESYYGKHATPQSQAAMLGGRG